MRVVDPPAEVRQHVDRAVLTKQAEAAHQAVQQADADAALKKKEAGEILRKLKKDVGPGNWKKWCAENLSFHYRTARRYMRIAENWDAIEKKVTGLAPGTPREQEIAHLSAGAALRLISKPRKGRRLQPPKISDELKEYEPAIKWLNREFGIKAPPSAVIGLMLRLGIPEATLKKTLKSSFEEQTKEETEPSEASAPPKKRRRTK